MLACLSDRWGLAKSRYNNFHTREGIWKCCLQNGGHFSPSLNVLNQWRPSFITNNSRPRKIKVSNPRAKRKGTHIQKPYEFLQRDFVKSQTHEVRFSRFPIALKWGKSTIPITLVVWIGNTYLTIRAGYNKCLKQRKMTEIITFHIINSMQFVLDTDVLSIMPYSILSTGCLYMTEFIWRVVLLQNCMPNLTET